MDNKAIELVDRIVYGPADNEQYWRSLKKEVDVFLTATEEEMEFFEDNWTALESLKGL